MNYCWDNLLFVGSYSIQIAIVAFWKYRFPNVGALTSIHREMSGGSDRSDVYLFVCLDNKHVLAAAHQRHLVTVTLINIILNIYINTNTDIWLGGLYLCYVPTLMINCCSNNINNCHMTATRILLLHDKRPHSTINLWKCSFVTVKIIVKIETGFSYCVTITCQLP